MIVTLVLEAGADVNAKDDNHSYTALQFAAALGQNAMINLLLEKGADLTSPTPNGLTALILAIYNGHLASATYCLDTK